MMEYIYKRTKKKNLKKKSQVGFEPSSFKLTVQSLNHTPIVTPVLEGVKKAIHIIQPPKGINFEKPYC